MKGRIPLLYNPLPLFSCQHIQLPNYLINSHALLPPALARNALPSAPSASHQTGHGCTASTTRYLPPSQTRVPPGAKVLPPAAQTVLPDVDMLPTPSSELPPTSPEDSSPAVPVPASP